MLRWKLGATWAAGPLDLHGVIVSGGVRARNATRSTAMSKSPNAISMRPANRPGHHKPNRAPLPGLHGTARFEASGFNGAGSGIKPFFDMPPPLLLLQDISLTFGGTPLLSGRGLAVAAGDRICLVGRNGSGQIDAAAHRRRAGPARCRRAFRATRRDDQLPAAGAGSDRLRHDAGLCRGGVRRRGGGRIATARFICSRNSVFPATKIPPSLSGGEARRAALARALAPLARHPAARRADQPPRPARHRVAGARTGRDARRHRADQP